MDDAVMRSEAVESRIQYLFFLYKLKVFRVFEFQVIQIIFKIKGGSLKEKMNGSNQLEKLVLFCPLIYIYIYY